MLALLFAKIILTPVSIGGGFLGGVFAPCLFIGAMLGGAFGAVVTILFPGLGVHPAAFALVGMAAVLAGSVHAPLTAIILLFEMTNDYRIILPLMFAVAVSMVISQRLEKDSVYAMGLARHGIRLDRGRDVELLRAITVGVLRRADVIRAYEIALTHRVAQRYQEHAVRLDAWTPARMDVSNIVVESGSTAAGKQMKEIPFPHDCVVASVRRGTQFFIPRGETVLYPGDILVMVADGTAYEEALSLCHRPNGNETLK